MIGNALLATPELLHGEPLLNLHSFLQQQARHAYICGHGGVWWERG